MTLLPGPIAVLFCPGVDGNATAPHFDYWRNFFGARTVVIGD